MIGNVEPIGPQAHEVRWWRQNGKGLARARAPVGARALYPGSDRRYRSSSGVFSSAAMAGAVGPRSTRTFVVSALPATVSVTV